MMSNTKRMILTFVALALAAPAWPALAQQPYRANDRQVQRTLDRIEQRTDTFRQSLEAALDQSRLDNTNREDRINDYVRDFEQATDQLRERFNDRRAVSGDVQEVLSRASWIENFMRRRRLSQQAERDWNMLRSDLNLLAQYYNVAWNWNTRPRNNGGYYGGDAGNAGGYHGGNQSAYGTLTGTYRLDLSRSERAADVAERATRGLSSFERDRVRQQLMRRLEAPDMLAIEQHGRSFTVASTLAPQFTFEADGRTQSEDFGSNRRANVRASMSGNQLVINTTGNRGSDFEVTFAPMNNGRDLRVTRRIWTDRLSQPVVSYSQYTRTSEVAQLDIYRGNQVGWNNDRNGGQSGGTMSGRPNGRFYVPDNTAMVAVLNTDLSTGSAREGDRFTMTVRSPNAYQGAVIEGYVGAVDRAGRVSGRSELALNFERIRLQNGQTYDFTGYIEEVRTVNGETVRVDNEGSVKDDDSQTQKTVTRAGIGAALGAVIGAIAGGGQGAAIGAAIGAGAGAGSVFIQGREDLDLRNGTEFMIRSSAPRR
jgi:hypothetical protein